MIQLIQSLFQGMKVILLISGALMNYLWIFEEELIKNDEAMITDSFRLTHLQDILKSSSSDQLKVVALGRGLGSATISKLSERELHLAEINLAPGEERSIDLFVGLSRPQTIKNVLKLTAGFPVKRLFLHRTELGEKSYETSKVLENEALAKHLLLGLSQTGRFHTLPEVEVCKYVPFSKIDQIKNRLLFHPGTPSSLKDFELTNLALAIGSERGYTNKELELFKENGFKECWLSDSILRVETALASALSGIDLLNF
jgi:16S rRNA (uracil1498-N3)-methyltransferase